MEFEHSVHNLSTDRAVRTKSSWRALTFVLGHSA